MHIIKSLFEKADLCVEMDGTVKDCYVPEKLKWVNKGLVLDILKNCQTYYKNLPMSSKTEVLRFLVKEASDWNKLLGIEIFPFVDRRYRSLQNTRANMVLNEEIRMLLPSRNDTLDQHIFRHADELLQTFKNWAKEGNDLL